MTPRKKYWLKFTIRWGIAVLGIGYVLWGITFNDRVTVLDPVKNLPEYARVLDEATEDQKTPYRIQRETAGVPVIEEVRRDQLWIRPDRKHVEIKTESGTVEHRTLRAIKPGPNRTVNEVLVEEPSTGNGVIVEAQSLVNAAEIQPSLPLVEIGLVRMVHQADPRFLAGAVFILPLCHLLTSLRWHVLLAALDIRISQARTFTINMVGAFYNAFMPGTTGGDVVKAYYAAKHAPDKRTRAVISVLVDRAIGLYALIVIGGTMAAYQWEIPDCRRVAKVAAIIVGVTLVGLIVFYVPALRRATGLNYLLKRLPMQAQVRKAIEAMEIYGQRPLRVLWAFMLAFPVHFASIMSAAMAGRALGLPLEGLYYWAVVPVIALVGAIPISPQGAGVMEFFAVQLTKRQGVTISQAFALTMAIRLVQMLWNLAAGIFVLRGGYHAPTAKETDELEHNEGSAVAGAPVPSPQP
jgi:uncharacterized protein (TIRG00374 family)